MTEQEAREVEAMQLQIAELKAELYRKPQTWTPWRTEEYGKLYAIRDLALLVRTAQKTYFKTRTQADLLTSKDLEKKLDKALNEYNARELPHSDNDEIAPR